MTRVAILVDDHDHARPLARAITDLDAGWVIAHAPDVSGLARMLAKIIPDVVVTDLRVPGVASPVDCLDRVRALWSGPLVALTGDGSAEAAHACVRFAAPLHLKPLTPREVAAALDSMMTTAPRVGAHPEG